MVLVAVTNKPLLYCKKPNEVHDLVYSVYIERIVKLLNKQFHEEDIDGHSMLLPTIAQYHMATSLVVLFYNDFASGEYSFDYLIEFYKIKELRECFRCVDIDLKLMFEAVEIDICPEPASCGDGIEHIALEHSFQIENAVCGSTSEEEVPQITVSIQELLNQSNSCTILIE